MERKKTSSEALSGSESQEYLPEGTKEGDGRMFKANPDFLLREIADRLQVETLLCTRHDPRTGTLLGRNCRGEEKVCRFYEAFGADVRVRDVYSDSYRHDRPIFSLGERCFHIEKDGAQTEFCYSEQYEN